MAIDKDDINRLYDKLDEMDKKSDDKHENVCTRLSKVEKELYVYNQELKRHIEGVELNREAIRSLKKNIAPLRDKFTEDAINDKLKSKWVKATLAFCAAVSLIFGVSFYEALKAFFLKFLSP